MITLSRPLDKEHQVSSKFGYRVHPVSGEKKMHYGVDYACPVGSPIYAACDGNIILAKESPGFGKWVLQKAIHGSTDYFIFYAHLDSFNVSENKLGKGPYEFVNKGEIIAYSGDTGTSSGPHLHFQICKDQAGKEYYSKCAIDPLLLIADDDFNWAVNSGLFSKDTIAEEAVTYLELASILRNKVMV